MADLGKPKGKATAPRAMGVAPAKMKMKGARKSGRVGKGARPKGTARAAGAGARPGRAPARPRPGKAAAPPWAEGAADPAGFFVARVRGEDAARGASHPITEGAVEAGLRPFGGAGLVPRRDEQLGELPRSYGEDALVALVRDPHSLFVHWDHAPATLRAAFEGLEHPRARLRLCARAGEGWELVREEEVVLESFGHYLHGLEPGRTYRAELRAVDEAGRDRPLGPPSAPLGLPPLGPSPLVDDLFLSLGFDEPLGARLGPGRRRSDFPAKARRALAHLSAWSPGGGTGGSGSAGGMGRRVPGPPSGRPPRPDDGAGQGEP